MMMPTKIEIIANIKTPAALISFMNFISECLFGLMKLQIFSMAVLNVSAAKTKPIQRKITTNSNLLRFKKIPANKTIKAINK